MYKIVFVLLLISGTAAAQKSVLYNERRQLIVDTSFHIDEHTYQNLPKIEHEVLPLIYNNIKISWLTPEEGKSTMVIVKLIFSKGRCTFEIVRAKQSNLEGAVYMACKAMKREYESLSRMRNEEFLVYVPVKLELAPDTYDKLVKKNNAITI